MTELDTRHRSSVYDSMVKSPNRAMLRATGMTDKDFETPIVGVISTWAENTPCNIHLHVCGGWHSWENNDYVSSCFCTCRGRSRSNVYYWR